MSGIRFSSRLTQFSDDNGAPLAGGSISFTVSGTTTLQDTYSDEDLNTENTNPVDLDADGRLSVDVFLDPTLNYRARLYSSADVLIADDDPVGGNDVTTAVAAHNVDTSAHYAATESQRGFVELASQSEVNTGVDTSRAVTPATLATRLTALTTSITSNTAPSGAVSMFAANAAPSGWLECNGAAVSRTTYAALFTAIGTTWGVGNGSTTFNLPDLRGEFARGWDNGRGIDTGRVFASAQSSANLAHTHTTDFWQVQGDAGDNSRDGFTYEGAQGESGVSPESPYESNSSGGTEARPRNIALMFIIKT